MDYKGVPELEGQLSLPEAGALLRVTRQRVFQMGAEEHKLESLRYIRGGKNRPAAYVVATGEILKLRAIEVCAQCKAMRADGLDTEYCVHTEYPVPDTAPDAVAA